MIQSWTLPLKNIEISRTRKPLKDITDDFLSSKK